MSALTGGGQVVLASCADLIMMPDSWCRRGGYSNMSQGREPVKTTLAERFGNVLYVLGVAASLLWAGWLFYMVFAGEVLPAYRQQDLFLAVGGAAIIYGIGWTLRYLLTGRTSL